MLESGETHRRYALLRRVATAPPPAASHALRCCHAAIFRAGFAMPIMLPAPLLDDAMLLFYEAPSILIAVYAADAYAR